MRTIPSLRSLFRRRSSSDREKSTSEDGDWSGAVPTQTLVYSRQKKLMPLPLIPSSRSRQLSMEDNSHHACRDDLSTGTSSSPLMRLPTEIRLQIFTYVLASQTIHLVQKPRRLGHHICPYTTRPGSDSGELLSTTCTVLSCWGMSDRLRITYDATGRGLLNLALTSRAVYRETIDLLYASNAFAMGDPVMLGFLQQSVLPARMAVVSSVALVWLFSWPFYDVPMDSPLRTTHPPVDEEKWERFWAVVRDDMPRLRHLHVDIWSSALKTTADDATERKILQPVEDLRLRRNGLVPLEVAVKLPWREMRVTCAGGDK